MTGEGAPVSRRAPIVLLLAVAVLAVYGRTVGFSFTSYDDPEYVTENPMVRAGLTARGVIWAFTTTATSNWHPLTWLSLMLDAAIGGGAAWPFHLTNMLLHLANTLLLFLAWERMTGEAGPSAFVAALFAVHPLHVESVAWVAERKDVLSTLFWMLTLLAWKRWTERPGAGRYAAVVSAFTLGLMAKPMLVSLPLVLLFLDVWPLGRLENGWRRLLAEKAPLAALAAASCAATLFAQKQAIGTFEVFPLSSRVATALVSYAVYLARAIWPYPLAVFYPHPGRVLPLLPVVSSTLVVATASIVALWLVKTRPYLAAGWLWYVLTLVPVIGLVQVGLHSRADRYTYVPLVGLFVCAAWGARDLAGERGRRFLLPAALASLALYSAVAFVQVSTWQNGITLFRHAVRVTSLNAVAESNLGSALSLSGSIDEALPHFEEALRINPHFPAARYNLGSALLKKGEVDAAVAELEEALRMDSSHSGAHYNLALARMQQGALEEAIEHFSEALRIEPLRDDAHVNLGVALVRRGRLDEAVAHFEEALRIDPGNENARRNLERVRQRKDVE